MPPHTFSPEELELLSEEEREGLLEDIDNEDADLEEDDTSPEDKAAAAVLEAEAVAAAAEMADPLKPAPVVEDVIDPAKQAEIAAALENVDVIVDAPSAAAFPKFEAPADSKEKLTAIEAQIDALATKFDDGELTAAEYRAQTKPLESEARKIERLVERAELSRDVSVETWTESTVPAFFVKHTQYAPGTPLYANLDFEVRQIQAESKNPFDPAILERAHKVLQDKARAALGLPPEDANKPAPKPAPVARRDLPPSLAGMPAADITETLDNSEFAHLDRLQAKGGTAFEDALAKLNDDQMARYLASA